MQLKQLLNDDDAVSPVIGVILMVAITVILAAVIGTFVLGLGDQVQQTSPNAQWSWDASGDVASGADLTLSHEGGQSVDATTLSLSGSALASGPYDDITTGDGDGTDLPSTNGFSEEKVTAGNSVTLTGANDLNAASGDEVRLVWTADGGQQSSSLTSYTVP